MKYRTTEKEVRNGYGYVFRTGYCNLQDLLSYENPIAYTCGVYGWNADIYHFEGFAIVTGYRPFGTPIPSEKVKEYERKAISIKNRKNWKYDTKRNALRRLAFRLCLELANN